MRDRCSDAQSTMFAEFIETLSYRPMLLKSSCAFMMILIAKSGLGFELPEILTRYCAKKSRQTCNFAEPDRILPQQQHQKLESPLGIRNGCERNLHQITPYRRSTNFVSSNAYFLYLYLSCRARHPGRCIFSRPVADQTQRERNKSTRRSPLLNHNMSCILLYMVSRL